MTREEAIEILKAHHMWTGEPQEIIDVRKENKALDMAIQALSQEPKTQMVDKSNFDIEQYKMDLQGAYDCGFEAGKKAEQKPCEKCEVVNPCLYCKHNFERDADNE